MTAHPYDKHYFHGGTKVGGYAGSGYRDFPVHWTTYAHVMKREPKSVLELGCGRGYLLKRFAEYAKIPVQGLEISEHCHLTRAIEDVVTHDVTVAPWPVADQEFDLCLSLAFLEHIPEDKLPVVFAEMARTCRRGLHGIDVHDGDSFDQTHCTIREVAWWKERLPPGHEAVDKEDLEAGPIVLPPGLDRGVKLNLGSFTHMFHGWRNLDLIDLTPWARTNGYTFTPWDLAHGLPYDDQVVDLIFLSHVLEHFDYAAGQRLLGECQRVLKPGGVLRVAVPDAERLLTLYREGTLSTLQELCGSELTGEPIQLLHELLYGGDHRAIYDQRTLVRALHAVGFTQGYGSVFGAGASVVMRRETIDLYPEMSLFVEAQR
jgi:predicted SAM-dependent methyltransferase